MAKIKNNINNTKKDIVLKNAAILFRKKGFKATSLRELADTMGIEAPSLYNHINSKAELLHNICFGVANDFMTNLQAVIATKESAVEKIAMLIRFHILKIYSDFDNVFVANHEWKQLSKKDLSAFITQRKDYENCVIEIIHTGQKNKQMKLLNAKIMVLTILSAVRGLEILQSHKNNFSLEELQDNMVEQLLNGIVK
ncbi:MAG: TetR/AcrR family transcriptional regulator [Ferruginibacter sp.]|nr:TetR/AcrR family transcriptional regulator [Ferruginibacter sp.]